MKRFVFLSLILLSQTLLAQTLSLPEFHYSIPDIRQQNTSKEILFAEMNRNLVRVNDSICSNRALMWVYDFKRKHNVESPKIFLFFTMKNARSGLTTWWYHVSPMVNEAGRYWAMDAGFPGRIKGPMLMNDWLREFTGKDSVCKEISEHDDDLVERMFVPHVFPETTSHGKFDCYYKIVPPGYWTPEAVAKHLLGHDAEGNPVNYVRDEIEKEEVFDACLEAATTPLGWAWGTAVGKCRNYIESGVLKI